MPNWILRELGTIKSNISWDGKFIKIENYSEILTLHWKDDKLHLGNFIYTIEDDILNIDDLIKSPQHWLGNVQLSNFLENPSLE